MDNRQRVYIMEGCDMCGKTQIAQALSKKLGIPYFKNDGEIKNFQKPQNYFIDLLRYAGPYFASFLKQTGYSAIIDRQYPSEWVYSKVCGRETDIDAIIQLDRDFADMGTTIIFCWRTEHLRTDDAFPEVLDTRKLVELQERYVEFCKWTKCKVVRLCVDDENLEREIGDVMDALAFEDCNKSFDERAFREIIASRKLCE